MKDEAPKPPSSASDTQIVGGRSNTLAVGLLSFLLLIATFLAGKDLLSSAARVSDAGSQRAALESAISWNPTAWETRVEYAEALRASGDNEAAIVQYERALEDFEGCPSCWIGIAEAQLALRRSPIAALELATKYGRSRTDVRTRTASAYARMGDNEAAAIEFAAAVRGKRDDQQEFFDLLTRIYGVDYVLDRMVTDDLLESYFRYARASLRPDDVEHVWSRYEPLSNPEQRDHYVGYLIERGLVQRAWRIQFDEPGNSVVTADLLDGDFSNADVDYGWFGWQMASRDGVVAERTRCPGCELRNMALRLSFDGEGNPNYFGVRQDVPLLPNRSYALSGRMMSKDISSDSGAGVFIQGLPVAERDNIDGCRLWVPGEPFRRTRDWTETRIRFLLPRECEGIRILVGRPQSERLNRFIGGEFWLDDVELRQVASEVAVAE